MRDAAPAFRYIQERLGIDLRTAEPATTLESCGVDSLALLELVFEIEEQFGVKLEERTLPPRSCGELTALIERLAASTA